MPPKLRRKSDQLTASASSSDSHLQTGLKASFSSGSVHGGNRSSTSFSLKLAILGFTGFLCGVTISTVLFLSTVGYSKIIGSTHEAVEVHLSSSSGVNLLGLSQIHARWLSKASKYLSIQVPVVYITWITEEEEYQLICRTWGRYIASNRIHILVPKDKSQKLAALGGNCTIPYTVMPQGTRAISWVVSHICKEFPLATARWYFLFKARFLYVDVNAFDQYIVQNMGILSKYGFYGNPRIIQLQISICAQDFGMLLSSQVLIKLCNVRHTCNEIFQSPRFSDLGLLSICLKNTLNIGCSSLPKTKIVGSQLVYTDSSPLKNSAVLLYHLLPTGGELYLEVHRKSLRQQLQAVISDTEVCLASMAVMKEYMPQVRYLHPRKPRTSHDLMSVDDIVPFDLIQFEQVYSDNLNQPSARFNSMLSQEVSQIARKVSEILQLSSHSLNAPPTFRIRSLSRRLLHSQGIEYLVQVEVAQGTSPSHLGFRKLYTVEIIRPLQPSLAVHVFPNFPQGFQRPLTILLNVSSSVMVAEKEVGNFCQRNMLTLEKQRLLVDVLIVVSAVKDSEEVTTTEKLSQMCSGRLRVVQEAHWPPSSDVQRIVQLAWKANPSHVLLFADWRATLSTDFLAKCRVFSIPRKQIYVPIPFVYWNNFTEISSENGFWYHKFHNTFCASADDFRWIFNPELVSASLTENNFFTKWLVHGIHIVQVVDEGLLELYDDDIMGSGFKRNCEQAAISRQLYNGKYIM